LKKAGLTQGTRTRKGPRSEKKKKGNTKKKRTNPLENRRRRPNNESHEKKKSQGGADTRGKWGFCTFHHLKQRQHEGQKDRHPIQEKSRTPGSLTWKSQQRNEKKDGAAEWEDQRTGPKTCDGVLEISKKSIETEKKGEERKKVKRNRKSWGRHAQWQKGNDQNGKKERGKRAKQGTPRGRRPVSLCPQGARQAR